MAIPLADQSVHLIVTSPPYWKARDYRDADESLEGQLGNEQNPHLFLAHLWAVLDDCWRVLRDDGNLWVNLGDKMIDDRRVGGGLRVKCRGLIPHRFALGMIDPDYRAFEEHRAGHTPNPTAPQWICRMDAVWSKPNGLPESVTDRVRASHEYWFHFTKSERYFAAMDEIREDSTDTNASRSRAIGSWDGEPGSMDTKPYGARPNERKVRGIPGVGTTFMPSPLGKLPGSVWPVATEPLSIPDHLPQHFAAFPSEFPRRIVLGWSPSGVCVACGQPRRPVCERTGRIVSSRGDAILGPEAVRDKRSIETCQGHDLMRGANGWAFPKHETTITGYACACPTSDAPTRPSVVLDPFSGTGTTAIVAAALGRHGVGVDLSWDYHRIARWRDQDGGLRAKALGVVRPAKELDGQGSLFG